MSPFDARDVTRPSTNRRPRRGRRPPPLAWAGPPRGDPTWSPGAVTSSLLMTSARPTLTNQKPAKRAKVGTITTVNHFVLIHLFCPNANILPKSNHFVQIQPFFPTQPLFPNTTILSKYNHYVHILLSAKYNYFETLQLLAQSVLTFHCF